MTIKKTDKYTNSCDERERRVYKLSNVLDPVNGPYITCHKDWVDTKGLLDNSKTTGKVLVTIRERGCPYEEVLLHRLAITKEQAVSLFEAMMTMFKEMEEFESTEIKEDFNGDLEKHQ